MDFINGDATMTDSWGPDIPAQNPAHNGKKVTYVTGANGKIKEVLVGDGSVSGVLQRKYLPTLGELIDRLVIVQLKAIHIHSHRDEYLKEMSLIEHDIDFILDEKYQETGYRLTANEVRAIAVNAISNNTIWQNESKAREGGPEQDHLLKHSHSVNGVRNTAKNKIMSRLNGERFDLKVDCIAAELTTTHGNWNVWTD